MYYVGMFSRTYKFVLTLQLEKIFFSSKLIRFDLQLYQEDRYSNFHERHFLFFDFLPTSHGCEHTPTETNCGGALLYIDNNINYIVRDDLCIYRSKELESVFIEIINSKGRNTIVGCVY